MKPDVVLTLGAIAFQRFEVPEEINFGGEQRVVTHDLVGGTRVVDVMGAFEDDKVWSGTFEGSNAEARARALEAMFKAGRKVRLTWSEFSYDVVITKFAARFRKKRFIPYQITCLVIGASSDAKPEGAPDATSMIKGDAARASERGGGLGFSSLTGALSSVTEAVRRVDDMVEQAATILAPVQAAREQAEALIQSIEGLQDEDLWSLVNGGSLGVVGDAAAALGAELGNIEALGELRVVRSTLQRMEINLTALNEPGPVIVTAGGDLYRIAQQAYGDVTAWEDIARANDLVDPMLDGLRELRLPQL